MLYNRTHSVCINRLVVPHSQASGDSSEQDKTLFWIISATLVTAFREFIARLNVWIDLGWIFRDSLCSYFRSRSPKMSVKKDSHRSYDLEFSF